MKCTEAPFMRERRDNSVLAFTVLLLMFGFVLAPELR
jgi:hypothetical protein